MVKCKTEKKKPSGYHFTECGLDYIYLLNGYEEENDPDYGKLFTIHNSDELHEEIARNILLYKEKFEAQEVKFFRSLLRLTQKQLGELLDADARTVQHWEGANDKQQITPAYESLLRILIWEKYLDESKAFEFFEQNKASRTHYKAIEMQESNDHWTATIAA